MTEKIAPYVRRAYYYETDKMSIVHHANYIRWFEEARIDFMRRVGLDCAALERRGILIPVTGVEAKYKSSVFFDEEIEVRPRLIYFNGVRAAFSYEIRALERDVLAVTGESWHCFIDEQTRAPVNMKKAEPEFYARAMELVEGGNQRKRKGANLK